MIEVMIMLIHHDDLFIIFDYQTLGALSFTNLKIYPKIFSP